MIVRAIPLQASHQEGLRACPQIIVRAIAPGFMQDLAGLIEQNRSRSKATSRIL
jgi:hypothetical protein